MIYLDGAKDNESAAPNAGIASTTGYLRIGDDAATKEKVKGIIDDVRLYSRVLSESEIKTLFTGKRPKE
jgi:hypothetical protein